MSQKNYMTYGDAETLFTGIGSKLDEKATKELLTEEIWNEKTWSGLSSVDGQYIWTDGDNVYYSNDSNQYVLNKSTSAWESKTWSGLNSFNGAFVWTDGNNIYYSNGSIQYVLNKSTSTWESKTWSGLIGSYGSDVWTDGDNVYYSSSSKQYVLNKSTSTWESKTWSVLSSFYGEYIWTDGDNVYYSNGSNQYVLNKSTSTWVYKPWSGLSSFYGQYIWTDGDNIYFSYDSTHYVLNKSTSTWVYKPWSGLSSFYGQYIWTDGDNVYYSNGSSSNQYVLNKIVSEPRFGIDINGNYGYYKVGADTVTPFKNPTGTKSDTYSTNGTRSVDIEDYANHSVTVSVPNSPYFKSTTLWTNSDPTASGGFAAQTITLSQSIANFDYIKIKYYAAYDKTDDAYTGENIYSVSRFRKATKTSYGPVCSIASYGSSYRYNRLFYYTNDTQIEFLTAYRVNANNNLKTQCIPVEIYGLKLAVQ